MYRKLKRTWSHGYANYIPKLKEVFPELNKYDSEKLCDKLIELNLEFYYDEPVKVPILMRFTLPFALILFVLMFVALPFVFLITGNWGYRFGEKNRIYNWFRSLRLL